MPKFTIEDHEKRMRAMLQPKPQAANNDLLTRFRDLSNKRKGGTVPPVIKQEI